jgi:hypothetical protein
LLGLFVSLKFHVKVTWPFLSASLAAQPTEFQHRAISHGDESKVETLDDLKHLLAFPITLAPYSVGNHNGHDLVNRSLLCPAGDTNPFPRAGLPVPDSMDHLLKVLFPSVISPEGSLMSRVHTVLSRIQLYVDQGLAAVFHLSQKLCTLPFLLPAPVGAGEVYLHTRLNFQTLTTLRLSLVDGQRRFSRYLSEIHRGPTIDCPVETIIKVLSLGVNPVTFLTLSPSLKDSNLPASRCVEHFETSSLEIQKVHEKTIKTSPGDR